MKIYLNKSCHKGDTFRELLGMWEESGYCELHESQDRFCWANSVGDVLLYEYARFDFMPEGWNFALFSNSQILEHHSSPWIFWARHPRKLEKSIEDGILPYTERKIQSIFLGKIENDIQYNGRMGHDWGKVIEEFSMPISFGDSTSYPYTQEEYLNKVKESKFGLVLPGYGPKCNREIEYFGLGTVPIYTTDSGLHYYDSLEEGVHYLMAKTPEEIPSMIEKIDENKWNELSQNGRDWYNKNCSRKGSFETTCKIIKEKTSG
jgi:hypothetical protein